MVLPHFRMVLMTMTLLQIRRHLAEVSGRYDLVDPTSFADTGMDFYIKAAQNMLDRLKKTPKSTSNIFIEFDAGDWYADMTSCRKVEEVWINNGEGRSQLEKKGYVELKNLYPSLISVTENGTPLYYAISQLRTQDNEDVDNLGSFFNHQRTDDDAYHGIIILPPPDESLIVEVKGLFYAAELTADSNTNFWTNNYPDLLVMAVLYKLEVMNRNTEGRNDWMAAIEQELMMVDVGMVDEEVHGINQIED